MDDFKLDGEEEYTDDSRGGAVDYQDDDNASYDSEEETKDDYEENSENEDAEESEEEQEVADPEKQKQSKEENAQFKKMRLKAEEEARKKYEAELAKLEADKKEIEAFRQQQKNTQIEQKYLAEVTPELVENFAYQHGIPEEFARKHLFQEAKNNAIQEITAHQNRVSQSQAQKALLKDKPYFKELEKDIDELISKDSNVDVNTAYNYLRGVKLDELIASTKSNTEKKTIANIQDKAKRRSVPSGGSDNTIDVNSVLSKDDIEMAIAFGNDPRAIAKKVKETIKSKRR